MSIRRAALWSLAAQYASFAIQFATSVVISRLFLLPADVGLFSIALAAAMVVSIFQDMGISRFVTGQPAMREDHVRDYAAVAVGIGWAVAAVVALAAVPLERFYGEAGLATLVLIIAAAYVAIPLGIVPAALLTRRMDFKALFFANAGSALVGGGVAVATAAAGAGPASLAWGMLATAVVKLALVQRGAPVLPRWPRDHAVVRPMLGFGGATFILSLSGSLGLRSQDLIVGRLLGMAATGLFTRAGALAGQMSMLVVGAINAVFYPAFARKRDAGEPLAAPYLHLVACNTALQWPAAVGLALAAEPVVYLLYGPNWMDVAPLLRWTALAEIFFVAIPLQMDIPILLGRIKTLVWVNLIDTALTVALLATFCLWGVEAAALSRIATGALWFAIYAVLLCRLLELPIGAAALTYAKSGMCALAAGLPLALARWFGWFGDDIGFVPLVGLVAAGGLCWLATLPLVRHPFWGEVQLGLAQVPFLRPTRHGA
ncbi:MAG: oligosaccharide flippase family protein [Alteraurantiacibacter sp.]